MQLKNISGLERNAVILSITEFIHDTGWYMPYTFWSLYILKLGASLPILGLITLATAFFSIIFQAIIGYASDRFGRKKPIVLGGFISSFAPFIFAMANNWTSLVPGVIPEGIDAAIWPAKKALLADSIHHEKRGSALALFYTIMGLPLIYAPIVGGIALDQLGTIEGMRITLAIGGFLKLLSAVLNLKFIEENPSANNSKDSHVKNRKISFSFLRNNLTYFFNPVTKNRALLVLIFGTGLDSVGAGLISQYLVVYAVQVISISKTSWGIVSGASSLASTLTRIPLGRITDRVGRRKCILIEYAFYPFFALMFAYSQNMIQLLILHVALAITYNIGLPALEAFIVDSTDTKERGRVYSIISMIGIPWGGVLGSTASSLGAIVWDSYGPIWSFYLSATLRASSALSLYVFLKENKKQNPQPL